MLISDSEFHQGEAAIDTAAAQEREPLPVVEVIELLVFRSGSRLPNAIVGQTTRIQKMADQQRGIEIVPYDSGWPVAFEGEAARLWSALRALALRIDHHGSTAIPGLSAKPIIDIQVSVAALQPAATYGDCLQALGYAHVPHADDAFCPFFHRPTCWPHTHHVHVVERGGHEEQRTLAFRDYLRDHGEAAREYETLKRALATRFTGNDPESREAYAHAKTDFVERVIALAVGSGYPRHLHETRAGQHGLQPTAASVILSRRG